MHEPNIDILTGLNNLTTSLQALHTVLNGAETRTSLETLFKLVNYLITKSKRGAKKIVETLGNLGASTWIMNKQIELFRNIETNAEIVRNGRAFQVSYRATALDLIEAMVMHDIAFDKEARELFKASVIDVLKNTTVVTEKGRVTLRKYFEMKNIPWEKVKQYLEKEIDAALNILRKELELYESPQPGNYVKGDKLAYYMYVRETLVRSNPLWRKVLGLVTDSVSYTIGVALASRRLFSREGLPAITRQDITLENALIELLRNPPEKVVSKLMESDSPYAILNEYRVRLDRMLSEALKSAAKHRLKFKLVVPVYPDEIESNIKHHTGEKMIETKKLPLRQHV